MCGHLGDKPLGLHYRRFGRHGYDVSAIHPFIFDLSYSKKGLIFWTTLYMYVKTCDPNSVSSVSYYCCYIVAFIVLWDISMF